MKTIGITLKSVHGNLWEATFAPTDVPLLKAWEDQIPWLLPNRNFQGGMPTGFEWLATGALAFWRRWYGDPCLEYRPPPVKKTQGGNVMVHPKAPPSIPLYELSVGKPNFTADAFLANVLPGTSKVVFFEESASPGAVLSQLEDYGIQRGWAIDDAIAKKKVVVYPLETSKQILFNEGTGLLDFGWTPRDGTSWWDKEKMRAIAPWKFVELRYWHSPRKVTDLETYEGRAVVEIAKGLTKTLCKVKVADGAVPFDPKHEVCLFEDVENAPLVFACPVDERKAFRQLGTSLKYLDEIQIPRTHSFGNVTIKELSTFLGRMLGANCSTSEECGDALGDYYKSIEAELVDALEPPRMVVSGSAGDGANAWLQSSSETVPKASELPAVQQAVRRIWSDGDETSEWICNLLCRAAVLLHMRHGTMFNADFRGQMYEPGQLMRSIIMAREKDKAQYLTQFVLVASIKKKRGQRVLAPPKPKPQGSPLAGGGVNFDDLFGTP
jgi:hypothetical protein